MALVKITSTNVSVTFRPEAVESVTLHPIELSNPNRQQALVILQFTEGGPYTNTRNLFYNTDAAAAEAYAAVAAAMEAAAQ